MSFRPGYPNTLRFVLPLRYNCGFVAEGPLFDVPPSIYQGPQPSLRIYRQDENVDLLCVASGYPPPKYVCFGKLGCGTLSLDVPGHFLIIYR